MAARSIVSCGSTSTNLRFKVSDQRSRQSFSSDHSFCSPIPTHCAGWSSPAARSFRFLGHGEISKSKYKSKMDLSIYCTGQPGGPLLPFWPQENSWVNLIMGAAIALPLAIQWVLKVIKEVDTAAETVEKMADAVEKVAEEVDDMAEEVAENLPAGGKLKTMLSYVENVAERAAKDAQKVEDLMDKVEELDKDVEALINSSGDHSHKAAKDQSQTKGKD